MLRFGIKSLLTLVTVAAVALAFAVMVVRLRRDQAELSILRREAGTLAVTGDHLIHIRNIATNDPYAWKWRLYVPLGTRLETGIELDGKYRSDGSPVGGGSVLVPSVPEGVVLSVSVSPLVNEQTTITVRLGDTVLGYSSTNLTPDDWLPTPGNCVVAAATETERFDFGDAIRLLARKIPGTSTDDWHPMGGKPVGLVVWAVPHKEK